VAQRRTLILDEDDLILVVEKEVVKQVDENRGEMTRSEFVNFLIQSQLKECQNSRNYVEKEEFHQFAQEMKELLRNFFEFFLSFGLTMREQPQDNGFAEFIQKVEALDSPEEENEAP